MTDPIDKLPLDDAESADKDDQISQQDIHSNGLDVEPRAESDEPATDLLEQAFDASEPAYTLKLDDTLQKDKKK